LLLADRASTVRIEGGTHVPWSPVFHYLAEIFLPFLRQLGAEVEASLERWGWYPAGGGACTLRIKPRRGLRPLRITQRGRLQRLTLTLGLAGLPLHIVEREEAYIRARLGHDCERLFVPVPSPGQGNVLFLKGEYEESLAGFSALGKRGKPAEQVAEELCRDWLNFESSGSALDKHLADQLLLYLALAGGESFFTTEEITSHLETNLALIESFLPVRFKVDHSARAISVAGAAFAGWQGELI
ncbi:MAG TPA: RNA 3'-terminal phosphate cyclase, partial [Desulfurivibrionaceae bacterium]|nr:RNA 3'-terminal phosphate cyclase [Desulfurivibrionaceae bacterium]